MFVDNTTHKIEDDLNLKGSMQNFGKVENVGVDEHPVYENFKQTISFEALPFKPFHKPLPDNFYQSINYLF